MSQRFIESFFPALTDLVIHPLQWTLESYFSLESATDTTEQCRTEVVVSWPHYGRVRNPILLFWALVGVVFGLWTSIHLMMRYRTSNTTVADTSPSYLLWSVAFGVYGLMNLVAVPLHCLYPTAPTQWTVPQHSPWLWGADTYCTGVFSWTVVAALLCDEDHRPGSRDSNATGLVVRGLLLVGCLVGGGSAVLAFGMLSWTLPLEVWYILPLCAAVATYLVTTSDHYPSTWVGRLAIAWALVGMALDAWACRVVTRTWSVPIPTRAWELGLVDSVRAPSVAFGACDLAFYALWLRIQRHRKEAKVE